MKKIVILLVVLLLSGCSFFQNPSNVVEPQMEKKGVSESVRNGDMYIKVEVTVLNDKITDVNIDEYGAKSFDGTMSGSKKELGDSYNMKAYSEIGREWYEQIESLEDYIIQNGIDKIELDENGRVINTDLKAMCSISVNEYLTLTKQAKENAETK